MTEILLEDLIDALRNARPISPEIALWDARMCGEFMSVSARHFQESIACRPDFPAATLLNDGPMPRRRWRAKEVQAWAERRKERRAAA